MKLLITGGVAGGASAAARARRLDEEAEIVMFERGEFVSFANCGLPYHVGEVIPQRSSLLVMTPEKFRTRTDIDVRVLQEVTAVNRDRKTVSVRNLRTGAQYEEAYDKLILATGSSPVRPPIPGADDPDVLQLWTIPDMDRIKSRVDEGATRAVVVGGGFIGLEIAENLRHRGLKVDLVEMLPQVMPALDLEMAQPLEAELKEAGIGLHVGRKVTAIGREGTFTETSPELHVDLDSGETLKTDFVVMSIGVRPNSELAADAGLLCGKRGGIRVDEHLATSDSDIYAVGDVVEIKDEVSGQPTQVPLAGPANRQGRIAADNAFGRASAFKGALGTSVVKVFNVTAGSVGHSEKRLRDAGETYRKVYLHPASHASYYPGGGTLHIKVLFADDGRILGAQVVGPDGVDKRVDVFATAMHAGLTVYDLQDLELAYAPPYGSAKDPVNFAGMIAANALKGDSTPVHWDNLPGNGLLLDVREPEERELGCIPDSAFIPLGQLRERMDELPKEKPIVVYCKVGLRGYLGERILRSQGFTACNLSGGWVTWKMARGLAGDDGGTDSASPDEQEASPGSETVTASDPSALKREAKHAVTSAATGSWDRELDARGLQCPGPIVQVRRAIDELESGDVLRVLASDEGFKKDIEAWCGQTGHDLLDLSQTDHRYEALVRKGSPIAMPRSSGGTQPETAKQATIVVFSNDLDKCMAAFIIATGFASLGTPVTMFFTFWGLNVLRKSSPPATRKDLLSRMFGFMMPRGARKLALSKMHMMGMGTGMMKHVMGKKNISSLPELVAEAKSLGVRFVACEMAMNVMGIQREELLDDLDETAGVANFAALSLNDGPTLFI